MVGVTGIVVFECFVFGDCFYRVVGRGLFFDRKTAMGTGCGVEFLPAFGEAGGVVSNFAADGVCVLDAGISMAVFALFSAGGRLCGAFGNSLAFHRQSLGMGGSAAILF